MLVDEFKPTGAYKSEFSIYNSILPSVIYSYNLTTGNCSETKNYY
jgi:hypothetical protein